MSQVLSESAGPRQAGRTWPMLVRWVEDNALILLVAILVVAAAVRVYAFRGYAGLDDAEYARFAYLLANGIPFPADYTGPAVFPLRIGVIAPTAAFYRLFGANEWTMVLYPLALSLGGVALAYWCASLFFGRGAGVVAAGLLAVFYWDIDSATRLLPDLPGAFFATVGVALIVSAADRWERAPRKLLLGGVAAGIAFGASWLSKETIAYLAPFCALLAVVMLRRQGLAALPLWAGVALGSGAVLAAEAAVYLMTTGDALFRLHEMERNYRQWPNGFFSEGSDFGWAPGTDYRSALIDRLFVSGPTRLLFGESFYGVPAIAVAATLIAWGRRRREYLVPALWLVSLLLTFNFASSSTESYVPLALFNRYLYLMFFPAIVVVGGFLWNIFATATVRPLRASDWMERGVASVAVAAMCWTAVPALYFGVVRNDDWWNAEVRALADQVTPETPVYADALSLRAFEYMDRYPDVTRWTEFADMASTDEIAPGSLVIVNTAYLGWLDRNAGMWINWPEPGPTDLSGYPQHTFYTTAPAQWRLILRTDNARVYRVDHAARAFLQ